MLRERPVRSNTIGSLRIFLGIPFTSLAELHLNYARIYQTHRAKCRRNCLQGSADNFDSLALFVWLFSRMHRTVMSFCLSQHHSPFFPKSFERCCVAGSSLQPFLSAVHPVSLPSVCTLTNRVAKVVFSVYELQLPTHLPLPYSVSSCSPTMQLQ